MADPLNELIEIDLDKLDFALEEEGVVGYLSAALRVGVWAVRNIINHPRYKGLHGYGEIPVDIDAPMEDQRYPYIHVMYRNNLFQPLGMNEISTGIVNGKECEIHAYRYEGSFMLNIYATTILERERIADCIIAAVGMDRRFRSILAANPFLGMSPNMATLASSTANESWGTPWDKDTMTAFRQFTFNVAGEFYMYVENDDEDVVFLKKIVVDGQPYSPFKPVPPLAHVHGTGRTHFPEQAVPSDDDVLDELLGDWDEGAGMMRKCPCPCNDEQSNSNDNGHS